MQLFEGDADSVRPDSCILTGDFYRRRFNRRTNSFHQRKRYFYPMLDSSQPRKSKQGDIEDMIFLTMMTSSDNVYWQHTTHIVCDDGSIGMGQNNCGLTLYHK